MTRKENGFNASGKRENPLSLYLDAVLALCAAFALVLDLNVRSGNNYINWAESLPATPVVTVLFAALLYGRRKARQSLPHLGADGWLLSLFLGFWWVLAVSVRNTQDVNQPFLSSGQLLKTLVMTVGMSGLYQLLFCMLAYALKEGAAWRPKGMSSSSLMKKLAEIYRRHTFFVCMAIILLAWLPHFVIAYPCAMNGDSVAQLKGWTGLSRFSSHHPPFSTMLIGVFYEIGLTLGDGAIGLALYIVAQMILAAAVLGYLQEVMCCLNAPLWLRFLSLFAACVCPVYADNITTILKDIPYSYGILLVLCEAAKEIFLDEKMTPASLLRLIAGGILIMLTRNNGKYVLIPLIVCMVIWAIRKPKSRLAAVGALAASVVLSSGIHAWMMHAYDIVPGSVSEMLSLPFQQTARFVREHEDEMTPEEYAAIEQVLGMSGLGKMYDPKISDPIKARFREETTAEEMRQYFSVWFEQFLKDPVCYVKATLIQNVLLLDPQTNNLALFSGTGLSEDIRMELNITETDARDEIRKIESNLRSLLLSLPGMAQLNSVGFHCCVLLFVCLWAAKGKRGGLFIILLPMVISMLVIVAGPCIQNQDRYGFPIVYCMPLVLACMSYAMRTQKRHDEVQV